MRPRPQYREQRRACRVGACIAGGVVIAHQADHRPASASSLDAVPLRGERRERTLVVRAVHATSARVVGFDVECMDERRRSVSLWMAVPRGSVRERWTGRDCHTP